ncbi:MAG: hypothetical protein MUF54_08650, partial [Polyangiaceae bacterium]|nr:hypothetical protein [Polyangiaceae bacterium]
MVKPIRLRSALRKSLTALAWLALVNLSCDFEHPSRPPFGYEVYDLYCSDGIDNDSDGLIDCADPECVWTSSFCGETIPAVPSDVTPEPDMTFVRRYCDKDKPTFNPERCSKAGRVVLDECSDGIDNDRDGQFDCGDRDCQVILETCCRVEVDDATCSDGIDNDQNGFADCADFSCSQGTYVAVCEEGESGKFACTDGKDNDGDGQADCYDMDCHKARLCRSSGVTEDTLKTCSDG